MIRRILSLLVFTAFACLSAQGSGIFYDANVSQGKMNGDKLYNFEGTKIGSIAGDSIHYILNGKEGTEKNQYSQLSSYPVDYQYAVRYSFLAGYEKSFNKVFSIRAAVGYQQALLNAYASTVPGYTHGDMTEVPFVSATIDRHWLTIPIDFKATLPIRRSGLYLAVGPKISMLLASTYADRLSKTTEDLGNLTPRFNLGLGFRFGAELAIAKTGHFFIESGYHRGLVNTSPIASATTQEGELALLGIGFRLNFPQKTGL